MTVFWIVYGLAMLIAALAGLLTFPNRIRTSVATWYWKWQWERGKIKFTMQNRRKDL